MHNFFFPEITKSHWIPSETCPTCCNKQCRRKFSLLDRPHHCRRYKDVFVKHLIIVSILKGNQQGFYILAFSHMNSCEGTCNQCQAVIMVKCLYIFQRVLYKCSLKLNLWKFLPLILSKSFTFHMVFKS